MKRGEPRFGWLIDGDATTPFVNALLLDDGERITARVLWRTERPNGPYHRWFHSQGATFGDGPLDPRPLPETLWFHDVDGQVALVGCRVASHRSNAAPRGVGEGVIDVRWAVIDGSVDYQSLNGLRTEIAGLSAWLGLRSVSEQVERDEANRTVAVDISLRSPGVVVLDRRLNLRLRPTFRWQRSADRTRTTVFDTVQIQTSATRRRSWEEHYEAHGAVRDLLEIAAWQAFPESLTLVNRADDPHRSLDGGDHGERWSEVRSYGYRSAVDEPGQPRFLFAFDDVGAVGFRRWIQVRRRFRRGIWPWMAIVGASRSHLQTQIAESGVGFEAVGFQLALDAGVARTKAKRESHVERLRRIAGEIPDGLLPDLEEWVDLSTDTYNGVKHANRDMPDLLTLVNVLRRNAMVFRVWVAVSIGVPTGILERSVPTDRLTGPVRLD